MGPQARVRVKKETALRLGEQNCLPHPCRSACSAPVSKLSLLKIHLFVIELFAIQRFDRSSMQTIEYPTSSGTLREEIPQGLASVLHRQELRRRLAGGSAERTTQCIADEDRLRRSTQLRIHATGFFDNVNGEMGTAQSKLRRSASHELQRVSHRVLVAPMHQFVDDAK